jgi:ATP-binding cassette subfamily B protein
LSIRDSLKENSKYIIIVLLLTFITAIIALMTPLLYRHLFDVAIPNRNIYLLCWILAGMIVIPFIESMLNSLQYYIRSYIGERVTSSLRKNLFQHAINTTIMYDQKLNTTQIVHQLTRNSGQIGVFIAQTIIPVISNSVMMAGLFITMILMDWRLGLLALLVLPPSVLLSKKIGQTASKLDREQKDHLETGDKFLIEVFNNITLVKSFGGVTFEKNTWNLWLEKLWSIQSKTLVVHNFNRNLLGQLINNVITGVILGIGAYFIVTGSFTVGDLVAFIAFLPRAYTALKSIMDTRIGLDKIRVALDKTEAIFMLQIEKDLFGQMKLQKINSYTIEFVNVSFQYKNEVEILKELSFKISENEMIAIVGPSGSGKSTILDLLMGFAVSSYGEIKVDNINIRELSIDDYRDKISIIPQDPILWDSTILNNIIYPDESGDLSSNIASTLTDLLNKLNLNHLLDPSKSSGLNSAVGNNGTNLSGGERQRIAIARALFRDKPILLVDEATSALDALTEKIVRDTLIGYKGYRTTIIIAHRLSTIMNVDRVFFLQAGRIIESGSPDELIKKRGLFYEYYNAQALANVE